MKHWFTSDKELVDMEKTHTSDCTEQEIKPKLCTCTSIDIFNYGCKCGGV